MMQIQVQREFIGKQKLDEVIISLFKYYIEKALASNYYSDKASTIPSDIQEEGDEI